MLMYLKRTLEWFSGSLNSDELIQTIKAFLVLCAISWCLAALFLWVIFKAILAWGFITGAVLFWLTLFAGNAFRQYLLPATVAYVHDKLWPESSSQYATAYPLNHKGGLFK